MGGYMPDVKPGDSNDTHEWTPPREESEQEERLDRIKRVKPSPLTPLDDGVGQASVSEDNNTRFNLPGRPSLPSHYTKPLEVALIAIIVLALGFGGGWLGAVAHHNNATDVTNKVELEGEATVISDIAKNVGQSVVSVNATQGSSTSGSNTNSPIDDLFGLGGGSSTNGGSNTTGETADAGTGMILTSSGLIMTNRHVVPAGTTSVSVTLSDGTVYNNVKVVGRTAASSSLDVAFLQIPNTNGKTLVPVSLGDSSKVDVGDQVVAIGNALGQFQNTVTSGIISGYGRSVQASSSDGSSTENLDGLFQTDAAINEGNSGGPLVDLDGQVIGMNTAIASDSQNIGFAIPVNDVKGLIQGVEKTGQLQQSYLGVLYVPITSDVASQYNLSVDQGAYIPTTSQNGGQSTVVSGGPADKAGIKSGDIITKVNGASINQQTSLVAALDDYQPGTQITLTIVRGGKTVTVNVTLGTVPNS
jgi:serine protease Do